MKSNKENYNLKIIIATIIIITNNEENNLLKYLDINISSAFFAIELNL